jgi:hypothetical protein
MMVGRLPQAVHGGLHVKWFGTSVKLPRNKVDTAPVNLSFGKAAS